MDKRWEQLADILVNYSTGVQPGERVMIAMTELASYPLTHAVYKAAIKAGAYPQVQFLSETLRHTRSPQEYLNTRYPSPASR